MNNSNNDTKESVHWWSTAIFFYIGCIMATVLTLATYFNTGDLHSLFMIYGLIDIFMFIVATMCYINAKWLEKRGR